MTQPTLRQALQDVPSTRIIIEQVETEYSGERTLTFWVESDDFAAFETAMSDDPTVTDVECLTTFSDRRLYRATQVGEGRAKSLYSALTTSGGDLQSVIGTATGWEYRVAFPDSGGLSRLRDICEEFGLDFTLLQKYQQTVHLDRISSAANQEVPPDLGLTPTQRETLLRAVDQGYYAIPREISLVELASQLGVSDQAVTERLRRAIVALTTNAFLLAEQESTPHDD
ncbi:helix-turn-helix domain-containing protein [Halomarina salina]|uniref:Helix-turn-helix domain-containing protein n=1 Tax=Halomarina salina TaxID=1872699 RepID=A0ABD5RIF5_9EURY